VALQIGLNNTQDISILYVNILYLQLPDDFLAHKAWKNMNDCGMMFCNKMCVAFLYHKNRAVFHNMFLSDLPQIRSLFNISLINATEYPSLSFS